jgi:hypothetical protein
MKGLTVYDFLVVGLPEVVFSRAARSERNVRRSNHEVV